MPPTVESTALGFRDAQAALAATAAAALATQWAKVDPANVMASWTAQLPHATVVLSGAQTVAAQQVDSYLADESVAQGGDAAADLEVVPDAFAGVASDGRALSGLLQQAGWAVMTSLGAGAPIDRAMAGGAATLDMIARTQVADAGRTATQVGIAGRHEFTGFVRIASAGACSRCAILAGKFYRYNGSFPRHPRCHCSCAPANEHTLGRLRQSPRALYDAMTARERQLAGWSVADQKAIDLGADLNQVTNAHRGLSSLDVAGRKVQTTTVGGARGRPRLTPQSVFDESARLGWSRAETVTQLHRHGYLTGDLDAALAKLAPKVDRATLGRAAAKSSGLTPAKAAAGVTPSIRPALAQARTIKDIQAAFTSEAERITGRRIPAWLGDDASAATAREHAEGILRGLERFPDAKLKRLSWYRSDEAVYADAESGIIRFNARYAGATARTSYQRALSGDVANWEKAKDNPYFHGWHPRGTNSPAAIALHEFGHVIDLSSLAEEIYPAVDQMVTAMAVRDGLRETEVIARQISQYAATDRAELVAEAFADVMMNGAAASELSRGVFNLLEDAYSSAGGRVVARAGRVAATADELNTTVANLRAMARERGVKIPAGARKADIQALLRDVGKPPSAEVRTFEERLAEARKGRSVVDLPTVQVQVDASAGADVGRWRATEVTGLNGSPRSLLSAITSRVRVSGHANEWLRFPEGRPVDEAIARMRAGYSADQRAKIAEVEAAQRDKVLVAGQRETKALDAAMRQSSLSGDAVLWRGVRPVDVGLPAGDATGFEWTDPGFVGTSATRDVAEHSFAQGTLLRILGPAGTPAISIEGGGEAEVLLGRGLRFRVVADRGATEAGARLLDVEVVPARAAEAVTPELSPLKLAQARQADIDVARGVSDMVADLRPRIADGAEPAVLRQRIESAARKGVIDAKTRTQMLAAADDPAKLDRLLQAQARKAGLKPIGAPGKTVSFDPALHKPVGGDIKAGAKVQVVAPGFQFTRAGEIIRLGKADVIVVETPLERMTIAELKAEAKARGIVVRASDKKADLLGKLKGETTTDTSMATRQASLERLASGTPTDSRMLGGGVQGQTELLTYGDQQVVQKTYRFVALTPREAQAYLDREILGPQVLEALGVRAPAVVASGPDKLLMEFIDGQTGADLVPWGGRVPDAILASDDGRMIGLSDILIGNTDRNTGNWIQMADSRLAGIDHGFAFSPGMFDGVASDFAHGFTTFGPKGVTWAAANDMSAADMALIRERLTALKPEFVKAGREDWYNQMMKRLAAVEKRAVGTRNRIAP